MNTPTDQDQALAAVLAREAADRAGETKESQGSAEAEPEELLDFLRGGLPTGEQEDLQQRILADPEASRRLLDLEALVRDGEAAAADTTGDLAAAAGWRELQGRLPAPTTEPILEQARQPAPIPAESDPRALDPLSATATDSRSTPFWLQPVAAMLLLSTIGLSILLLQRPTDPTPVALANLQTLELFSGQRSGVEVPPIAVAPEEPITLLLDPVERCPSYRLTVEGAGKNGAGGTTTLEGLTRDTRGAATNLQALVRFSPGSYTAILEGCSPRKELERYTFQVTEAP